MLTVLGSHCASQSERMSSPWWSASSWDEDNTWRASGDRGGTWQSESPAGKKDFSKDRDKFKNVTSLGAATKHPLPLEDRKTLLVAVVNILSPHKTVLSKIAVSAFSATTTHALLYLLCRAGPRMAIRLLRDDDGVFTIDYAAQQLAETAQSLHTTEVG